MITKAKNLGLAALVAGSMFLSRCGNSEQVDPISHFKDDVVLVACENQSEYAKVLEGLRYRNALKEPSMKMKFIQREDYLKVIVPNVEDGARKESYMHVVKKDNLKDVLEKMNDAGIFYDIVQLRGHDKDMKKLYALTKDCSEYYSIYFFGGCNSDRIAERKESARRATIGGNGVQDSDHNTFYLLNMIKLIGTQKASSWQEFKKNMTFADSDFTHYVSR